MWYLFFFKQKTAYEMRISDWSSDVCSSDLSPDVHRAEAAADQGRELHGDADLREGRQRRGQLQGERDRLRRHRPPLTARAATRPRTALPLAPDARRAGRFPRRRAVPDGRSPFDETSTDPAGGALRGPPDVDQVREPSRRIRTDERSEEHTSELQSLMRLSYA